MCTLLDRSDGEIFARIRGGQTDDLFTTKMMRPSDYAVGKIRVTNNEQQLSRNHSDSDGTACTSCHRRRGHANEII